MRAVLSDPIFQLLRQEGQTKAPASRTHIYKTYVHAHKYVCKGYIYDKVEFLVFIGS